MLHPTPETYLGDGVYASFDGEYIWLRAPREDGDHRIALEPGVFKALSDYFHEVWKEQAPAPQGDAS